MDVICCNLCFFALYAICFLFFNLLPFSNIWRISKGEWEVILWLNRWEYLLSFPFSVLFSFLYGVDVNTGELVLLIVVPHALGSTCQEKSHYCYVLVLYGINDIWNYSCKIKGRICITRGKQHGIRWKFMLVCHVGFPGIYQWLFDVDVHVPLKALHVSMVGSSYTSSSTHGVAYSQATRSQGRYGRVLRHHKREA